MEAAVIQRQYDEVISLQYDQDPQDTTAKSLERALDHISEHGLLNPGLPHLRVLDVGMGTGMFLDRLRLRSERRIEPFGLDISPRMAAIARGKLPDLTVAIDDGANLGRHFSNEQFDLAASHFVTGFVPLEKLASEIFNKLCARWLLVLCRRDHAGLSRTAKTRCQSTAETILRWSHPHAAGNDCPSRSGGGGTAIAGCWI
ncbi:MAG UNVERIFIED_CONTAM: class I SAM-dependent methyltransferase [Planctomycetaceae bacterium]